MALTFMNYKCLNPCTIEYHLDGIWDRTELRCEPRTCAMNDRPMLTKIYTSEKVLLPLKAISASVYFKIQQNVQFTDALT